MFRGGQPYTDFKAINCKRGRFRLEGRPGGIKFEVPNAVLEANRTIWICDGSGSLMVRGYHLIAGTAWVGGTLSLVPVGSRYLANALAVTGIHVTSIVMAGLNSTVTAAGLAVADARCTTDGYLQVGLTCVAAATVANASVQISYMVLNPQTT